MKQKQIELNGAYILGEATAKAIEQIKDEWGLTAVEIVNHNWTVAWANTIVAPMLDEQAKYTPKEILE